MDEVTEYAADPAVMALKWESLGAQWIHVVDLDGAFAKTAVNASSIKAILDRVSVPIQVGGGIRDIATIEAYLDAGVTRVIIGSEAVYRPEFVKEACRRFQGKIVVGIDARNGMVAVEGWSKTSKTRAVDLAREFETSGVAAINFTDIHRDGMQTGPNIEETAELARAISIPVIASGGVATLADIENLRKIEPLGVTGVITGRALYEGTLDLKEAIRVSGN